MILISGAGASDIAAAALAVRSIPAMKFGADLGLVGADGAAELHGIRNDVAGGAAVNGAEADDAEFGRVLFPADHALHLDDETRGDADGIDRRVRRRAVAAAAVERDLEAVGGG